MRKEECIDLYEVITQYCNKEKLSDKIKDGILKISKQSYKAGSDSCHKIIHDLYELTPKHYIATQENQQPLD